MVKVLEEVGSEYNGRIKVIEDFRGVRLVVGKLDQSGGAVVGVLRGAISLVKEISRGVILGLGGGTAVRLMREKFPEARLVAVEVDPVMIGLAEKYFGVAEDNNLCIICGDAAELVADSELSSQEPRGYDFVLVDCYLGREVPEQCEAEEFLLGVKVLLTAGGLVVFNRLFYDMEARRKAQEFVFKLEGVFGEINLKRAESNLLICCRV